MNRQKINEFIEKMEEAGNAWTKKQVQDVYGGSSFEEASIQSRLYVWDYK